MKRMFIKFLNNNALPLFFFFAIFICCSAVPQSVWAKSAGIANYSGKSGSICTNCHSGGTVPTVTIAGPASLSTGASGTYTVTINGGAGVVGGFDAAASSGTLQATAAGTKLSGSDVVHSASKSFTSGSVSFSFTLSAPVTAGTVTLYASGLSANGNGSTSGDNAAATTFAVTVTAAATAPQIVITDSTAPATDLQIPFGSVNSGLTSLQTVTVSNSGTANLNIGTLASVNSLAAPFSIPTDNCSGKAIAPGASCTISVRFAPIAAGPFSDTFDIPSDDPTTPSAVVSLSGTGVTPPSAAQIVITDAVAPTNDLQISFWFVNDGLTSDQTFTVSNGGGSSLVIGTIASSNPVAAPFTIVADNCSGQSIAAAGSCTVKVRFAPTVSGLFSDSFNIPSNDPVTPSAVVSVSGTGNAAPTAPDLVSPADGVTGLGTSVTLDWDNSTDADNDSITYHLYSCTNNTFTSCTPVDIASNGTVGIYLAGSGALFFGFVFAGDNRGRKMMLMLMIAMLLVSGAVFVACGGGHSSFTPASRSNTNVTHQISGLSSGTTYYWKVVADDGKGGLASSPTWSFRTL